MEEKRSLFSIQIDDLIIQRVFKSLDEKVNVLNSSVAAIQEDLLNRPQREEVDFLKKSFKDIETKTGGFTSEIDKVIADFRATFDGIIEETKEYVRDQISEAVFSVNNAIRAENALIQEKVFEMTKPSLEFSEMQADIEHLKQENKELRNYCNTMRQFFESFIGKSEEVSLQSAIDDLLTEDRNRMCKLEMREKENQTKLNELSHYCNRVIGGLDGKLPQWKKCEKKSISEKPQLPVLEHNRSIIDYLDWMMSFGPNCQKTFNCFYKQLANIAGKVYSWEERQQNIDNIDRSLEQMQSIRDQMEQFKADELNVDKLDLANLITNFEHIKEDYAQKSHLQELKEKIDELSQSVLKREDIDDLRSSIEESLTNVVEEVSRIKSSRSSRSQRANGDDFEELQTALTAVSPRGIASFRMIYGDKQKERPQTSRSVKRQNPLEEPGKESKRLRPLSKINVGFS